MATLSKQVTYMDTLDSTGYRITYHKSHAYAAELHPMHLMHTLMRADVFLDIVADLLRNPGYPAETGYPNGYPVEAGYLHGYPGLNRLPNHIS